eukprot:74308-Chlamydomonas_euryale.AAC.1
MLLRPGLSRHAASQVDDRCARPEEAIRNTRPAQPTCCDNGCPQPDQMHKHPCPSTPVYKRGKHVVSR